MASRSVEFSDMFGWIGGTFKLIGRDVGAFMGASVTSLVAYILFFLPMMGYAAWQAMTTGGSALASAATPFAGGTTFWILYALTILGSIVLLPPIMIGWFRLCRAVDSGQPARALDVLSPYRDPNAWGRALVTALLMLVLCLLVFAVLAAVFWSSFQEFLALVAAQQAATLAGTAIAPQAPPVGFFVGYFLFLAIIMVAQFAYMVAFAEVSLTPRSPVEAMRNAFAGVGRNALKLLLFMICVGIIAMLAMLVVGLVLALVIAALSMLGKAVMFVGILLIYIPFVLLLYPIMFASTYLVWKSMLGDSAPPPVPAPELGVLSA